MVFGDCWIFLDSVKKVCQIWYLGTVVYSWIDSDSDDLEWSCLFISSCVHRLHNQKKIVRYRRKRPTSITPRARPSTLSDAIRIRRDPYLSASLPMSSSSRAFFIKVTMKNSSMLKFFSLARLDLQIYPRKAELCMK